MQKKLYNQFIISTTPFLPDIISGSLWSLPIEGITEEDQAISAFAEGDKVTETQIKDVLNNLIKEKVIQSFNISTEEIENRNWNEEWEKTINVIKVSDKIVIKPTFREYQPKHGEIVLTIDPKMSFGTGEHQSTKLMLQMIEKHVRPGIKVLDAGSGTGVLAIAAVKLGAASAIAFDNDEWCFDNANENCSLNGVVNKVEVKFADITQIIEKDFDLVLANINKNILLDISSGLADKLGINGMLILSGILDTDETDITKEYSRSGLSLHDKLQMDNWLSLSFIKQ